MIGLFFLLTFAVGFLAGRQANKKPTHFHITTNAQFFDGRDDDGGDEFMSPPRFPSESTFSEN